MYNQIEINDMKKENMEVGRENEQEEGEWLKRYYSWQEGEEKLKKLCDYYSNTSVICYVSPLVKDFRLSVTQEPSSHHSSNIYLPQSPHSRILPFSLFEEPKRFHIDNHSLNYIPFRKRYPSKEKTTHTSRNHSHHQPLYLFY